MNANHSSLSAVVTARDTLELLPMSPAESRSRDSVEVRVSHAGIGFTDALARAGNYPLAPRAPYAIGYEFAGTIASGAREGERVCGLLPTLGAAAQTIHVSDARLVPIPDGVDDHVAAAIALNYLTALAMIHRIATLSAGDTLLVHGAAGGVGTAVLQLADLRGIHAVGTASPAKHPLVRSLGATPIDYTSGNWVAHALSLRPDGYDAVFDSIGGEVQRDSWRVTARRGTLISYGFYSGTSASLFETVQGMWFLGTRNALPNGKRARLCALPSIVQNYPGWYRSALASLLDHAREGALAPVIDTVVPLSDAAEALDRIEQRQTSGKVVLAL